MRRLSALLYLFAFFLVACERHIETAGESVTPAPEIESLKVAAANGDRAASDRVANYYFERESSFPASEIMRWDHVAANNGSIPGALNLAFEYYHLDGPFNCKAAKAWARVVVARTGNTPSPVAAVARRSAEDLLNESRLRSC
jgi:hypothetical protein